MPLNIGEAQYMETNLKVVLYMHELSDVVLLKMRFKFCQHYKNVRHLDNQLPAVLCILSGCNNVWEHWIIYYGFLRYSYIVPPPIMRCSHYCIKHELL